MQRLDEWFLVYLHRNKIFSVQVSRFFLFTGYIFFLGLVSCKKHELTEMGEFTLKDKLFHPVSLTGLWEFYPSSLIEPGAFETAEPYFVAVPAPWNSYLKNDKPITPNYNCATFRLKVFLNNHKKDLGLIVPKIWTANRVYANGVIVSQAGTVGCSYEQNRNKILERIVKLPDFKSDTLELVVHVGNYDFFIGGIIEEFWVGTYRDIEDKWNFNNTWALMWIGCLLLMCVYHLILFLTLRENKSLIYFSGICLMITGRYLVFGDHFIYSFLKENNYIDGYIQPQIYYSLNFILSSLGLSYVLALYREKWAKKLLLTSYSLMFLGLLIVILSKNLFFILFIPLQAIIIFNAVSILITILKAVYYQKSESFYQLFGISMMIFAAVNDSLHTQGIDLLGENELIPVAFGSFVGIQIIVLAKRFSFNFNQLKELSAQLENKVRIRTRELEQSRDEIEKKGEALQDAYRSITDSLKYARRIQIALLGQEENLIQHFKDAFLIFEPKDVVSGDFYWYAVVGDHKIIAIADCTGHGVPGAFMTLIGNDALDEIVKVRHIVDPSAILTQLDKRILETLHQRNTQEQRNEGMDMAIVAINELEKTVIFAGAKNPIFFVSDDKKELVAASKFPVGSNQYQQQKIFQNHTINYKEGDKIYMFSDGFQDQFGGSNNKKFMSKRFRELIFELSSQPMSEQKQRLLEDFRKWKGEYKQTDDVLLLGFVL